MYELPGCFRALEKRLNQLVGDFEVESDKRKQKENELQEVQSQLAKAKSECKEVRNCSVEVYTFKLHGTLQALRKCSEEEDTRKSVSV